MAITQGQVDDLRERLGVAAGEVPDATLSRCLRVSEGALTVHVPARNRETDLYLEGLACLAVMVFEGRARGRVGVDPSGDFDVAYVPGPTAGMVRSVWGYIGPVSEFGGGGFG